MIRRIQALNFRCLRYVDLRLDRFHVLIGPNASGKSTLFDAIAFMGDVVRDGLDTAVGKRTLNFRDLVWNRPLGEIGFELAIEVDVPLGLREQLPSEQDFRVFRYEVAIRDDSAGLRIASERALLMPQPMRPPAPRQISLFPSPLSPPPTILLGRGRTGMRSVVSKSNQGTDSYYVETAPRAGKGWVTTIAFGPRRSTLGNLPESPDNFPVSTSVKRMLAGGIRRMCLDNEVMRRPSPPQYRINGFAEDGSNLPWVVKRLREQNMIAYIEWLEHVRTVLPDLDDLHVVVRPEDLHAYLTLVYGTGVKVPSWTASDGTLRLLALTLLAYLPENREIHLLEEPENGIHPLALEAIRDSLWSAYDAQVLTTTHSPALLQLVEPSEVFCFDKDNEGATDIVRGNKHPILAEWQGALDKNVLFAKGLIG